MLAIDLASHIKAIFECVTLTSSFKSRQIGLKDEIVHSTQKRLNIT